MICMKESEKRHWFRCVQLLCAMLGTKFMCGSQYFSPFLSVDMNKMAESFNCSVKVLTWLLSEVVLILAHVGIGKRSDQIDFQGKDSGKNR